MMAHPLLPQPEGETLLGPGFALLECAPLPGERAASLRQRAEAAVRAGQALGRVTGGVLRVEPLLRLASDAPRRTPALNDTALDGWRVTLRLRLQTLPPLRAALPSLREERHSHGRTHRLSLGPPRPYPLTLLLETPASLRSVYLPQALPMGPLTLSLETRGEAEISVLALEDVVFGEHV